MENLTTYISDNKDFLQTIVAILGGLIALATFIKAIYEYRLQGRQKRADYFDKLKNRIRTDKQLKNITDLLEDDHSKLIKIPIMDRYYFLGFHEEIGIAVNSGLIKKNVAHYFFGYFAIQCWDSENFWLIDDETNIDKNAYYWATFAKFVADMKKIETKRTEPNLIQGLYNEILYRRLYRF